MENSAMKSISLVLIALSLTPPAFSADGNPVETTTFQESPLKGVCSDVSLLSSADFEKNHDFWQKAINDCGVKVQVVPVDGGFINAMTSITDRLQGLNQGQTEGAAFLKQVGDRAIQNLEFNNKVNEVLAKCVDSSSQELVGSGTRSAGRAMNKTADKSTKAMAAKAWFAQQQKIAAAQESSNPELAKLGQSLYNPEYCDKRLAELRSAINDIGPGYRKSLALMEATAGTGSSIAAGFRNIFQMNQTGEAVPLSEKEQADVNNAKFDLVKKDTAELMKIAKENLEALKKFDKNENDVPKWVLDLLPASHHNAEDYPPMDSLPSLAAFKGELKNVQSGRDFAKFYENFAMARDAAPILAYLGKRDPSNADISAALAKLTANGKEALKKAKGLMADKKDVSDTYANCDVSVVNGQKDGKKCWVPLTDSEKVDQMLPLMKFGGVVRDLLAKDSSSCNAAAGLVNLSANKSTRESTLIMGGLLAAGIVTGGVANAASLAITGSALGAGGVAANGIALSGAMTIPFAISDYNTYQEAMQTKYNAAQTLKGPLAQHDVGGNVADNAANDAMFSYMANLSMFAVGTPLIPGWKAAARFFQDEGIAKSLAKELTARKMSPEDAGKLIKSLRSGVEGDTRQAAEKIAKTLGEDQPELLTLANQLVKKGLLDPKEVMQRNPFASRLIGMSKEDRNADVKAVSEFIESLKPGEVPAPTKRELLEAVAARRAFSKDEADTLMRDFAKVKDWDSKALSNLTAVYDEAAAAKKANNLLTNSQAMDQALERFGVKDAAARARMCECPGVCERL